MESKKAIIEALLFLSSRPLKDEEIKAIVGRDVNIDILIEQLEEEYRSSGRAFTIRRVANGYQMFTRPEYSPYIDMLFKERRRRSLSRAALETLAIIAYKQPTTKSEIEWVRGVDSSGVIKNLLERGLITVVGRSTSVGRPLLYATTDKFLELFGLSDLGDLPAIDEIGALEEGAGFEDEVKQVPLEGWNNLEERGR